MANRFRTYRKKNWFVLVCKLNQSSFLPSADRIVSNSLFFEFVGSLLTLLEVSTSFATLVKLCE